MGQTLWSCVDTVPTDSWSELFTHWVLWWCEFTPPTWSTNFKWAGSEECFGEHEKRIGKHYSFLDKCWTVLDPVAVPNPGTVILASRHFQLKRAYHMLSGADCKFLENLLSASVSPLACTTPWSCVHLTFWSIHLEAINGSLSQISLGHLLAPRSWFLPL